METETKQEDVAASAPSTKEVVEQSVEQLQAKLKDYEAELATVKKERADNTRASQKWQQRAERIDSLEGKLNTIESMVAALAEATLADDSAVEEVTPPTRIERFKARLPKPQQQVDTPNPEEVSQMRVMFKKLVDKNKLDPHSLPDEVKEAWEDAEKQYKRGDLESAYDTLDKGIENYKVTEAERKRKREEMDKLDRETKSKSLQSDRRSSEGAGTGKYTAKDVREFAPTGNITEMKARIAAINKQMRGET